MTKTARKPAAIFTIAEAAKLTNNSFFWVGDLVRKGLLTTAGGGQKQGCRIELGMGAVVSLEVVHGLRDRKFTRGQIQPISLHLCGIGGAKLRSFFRTGKTTLLCWPGTFQPPKFVALQAAEKVKASGAGAVAIDLGSILGKLLGPHAGDAEPAGND